MFKVLHIVDRSVPMEMLRQAALLGGPRDRFVSIGPPPSAGSLHGRHVQPVHVPLGLPALAGWRMRGLADDNTVIHAWSMTAWDAGWELTGGRALVLSLPAVPSPADLSALVKKFNGSSGAITLPTQAAKSVFIARAKKDLPPSMCDHLAGRIFVLPPACSTPPGERQADRDFVRGELGVQPGQRLLLALGEMVRGGGHTMACWAHALVLQLNDSFRLLHLGDGPYRNEVEFFSRGTGCHDHVTFAGERFSLDQCLHAADAALLLGDCDLGLYELAAAMRAGVPVLAADTAGIVELTDAGRCALLVPPGEPRQAAAGLLKLLEDHDFAAELGRSARDKARMFDPAVVGGRLHDVYAHCAVRSGREVI